MAKEYSLISNVIDWNFQKISGSGFQIPNHSHHYYQMDVILCGNIGIQVEGHSFKKHGPTAWLLPPLIRHSYFKAQNCRYTVFKFQLSPGYSSYFSNHFSHIKPSGLLIQLIQNLLKRKNLKSPFIDQQVFGVITQGLLEMVYEKTHSATTVCQSDLFRTRLLPLMEKIQNSPDQNWSVHKMAQICHVSTDYFSRCFRKIAGRSPSNYLSEISLQSAAQKLIRDPLCSIKDVAEKTGYTSVHSFTRAFKNIFGVGPATYRRSTCQIF